MAGHRVASDIALTAQVMTAEEAYGRWILNRPVADEAELTAETIASAPAITVRMAWRTIASLARDEVLRTNNKETVVRSLVFASDDHAEMKSARTESRVVDKRRRLEAGQKPARLQHTRASPHKWGTAAPSTIPHRRYQ